MSAFFIRLCPMILLALCAPLAANAADWPQSQSDIPADPTIKFGNLPNGMRYAIKRNTTPSRHRLDPPAPRCRVTA